MAISDTQHSVRQNVASAIVCEGQLYVAAVQLHAHQAPELMLSISEPLVSADTLGAQVSKIAREANLKGYSWNFTLNRGDYQLVQTDVPDVPDAEVENTLKLKASDLIHLPLSEAAIAVSRFPTEAYRGRLKMAYIIAANRPDLIAIQDQFGLNGLKLSSIDILDMAMRNLALLVSDKPCYATFTLGMKKSSINCYFNGHMCLQRDIDITSVDLVIGTSDQHATSTSSQRELSLATLTLEVQRSLDYFESQLALGAIADILVVAPESLQDEIVTHFDHSVQPRVLPLHFAECLTLAGGISPTQNIETAFAIGGALRHIGDQP